MLSRGSEGVLPLIITPFSKENTFTFRKNTKIKKNFRRGRRRWSRGHPWTPLVTGAVL